MFGAGSVFFGGIPAAASTPTVILADNGLSIDSSNGAVVLGNDFGAAEIAALFSFREIDLSGFSIFFDNNNNFFNGGVVRFVAIGQNPFIIDGISIQEDLTAFPLGVNNRIGINIDAVDVQVESFWCRALTNDAYIFGAASDVIAPISDVFYFWDATGNTTLSDVVTGLAPDVGIRYFVYGDMGMRDLPTTTNAVKNVAWDSVTMRLVDSSGTNAALNGLSVNASGEIVLGNDVGDALAPAQFSGDREIVTNGDALRFSSAPGSTDNLKLESDNLIITNTSSSNISLTSFFDAINAAFTGALLYTAAGNSGIFFLDSGNVQFLNGSAVPVADNGDPFQFSNGATGTFTTVDLKTVTVRSGIVTSIV